MNYKKVFEINRFKVFKLIQLLPVAGARCPGCLDFGLKEMRKGFLKALICNDMGMKSKARREMKWFYHYEEEIEGWALKYEGDVDLFNCICNLAYTFAGYLGTDRREVAVKKLKWADEEEKAK